MRDFDEETGKPIAHYYQLAGAVVGGIAQLRSNDHPSLPPSMGEGNKWIFTSMVLEHNRDTGRIETVNTVYMPEVISVPE